MQSLNRVLNFVSNALGAIAMLFLAFLMFGTTLDVAMRAITGSPITGVFEFTELALVMLVFLGAGWAQRDDAHIRVNVLTDKLSPRAGCRPILGDRCCGSVDPGTPFYQRGDLFCVDPRVPLGIRQGADLVDQSQSGSRALVCLYPDGNPVCSNLNFR